MRKIYKLHLECSKRRKFVKVRETRVVPRVGKLESYKNTNHESMDSKLMLLLFTINLRRNDEHTSIFERFQNGFKRIFHRVSIIFFQENQVGIPKFQFEILHNPALRLSLKSIARLIPEYNRRDIYISFKAHPSITLSIFNLSSDPLRFSERNRLLLEVKYNRIDLKINLQSFPDVVTRES